LAWWTGAISFIGFQLHGLQLDDHLIVIIRDHIYLLVQSIYFSALIVAAAKVSFCGYLLNEDSQAGRKLDGIEVLNPFLPEPESI
jgi:hypothetical protein